MDGLGGDRLPQFLYVGTQKGGTTTLHALLSVNPKVFLPQENELHFFSLHHGSGPRWYENHFLAAAPGISGTLFLSPPHPLRMGQR
jgi:hypothetical protein